MSLPCELGGFPSMSEQLKPVADEGHRQMRSRAKISTTSCSVGRRTHHLMLRAIGSSALIVPR
jgi:hypothetical protein